MALNPEFKLIPEKLHEALLTSPATKSDAATYMINTGGLTLSQAAIEAGINRIISDLFTQLVLNAEDYATLLARHQTADPTAALRVLKVSGKIMLLKHEKAEAEATIANATAEWISLTPAQRAAIPNVKDAADAGLEALNGRIYWIDNRLEYLDGQRNLGG